MIKLIRSLYYRLKRRLKGPNRTTLSRKSYADPVLVIKTFAGYSIEIFCEEIDLKVKYYRFFVKDKKATMYRISTKPYEIMPKSLLSVIQNDIYIPKDLTTDVTDDNMMKQAIAMYLDIINDKIRGVEATVFLDE